jgi:hypothetical protein
MSLYPSLEDMTVGKMAKVSCVTDCVWWKLTFLLQAQASQQQAQQAAVTQGYQPPPEATTSAAAAPSGLYPSLEDEYMGLQLTQYRPVSG